MTAKNDWADGQIIHASDVNSLANEVNGKQLSDSDLTAIAGLSPANDDVLQRKSGAWTNRTVTQLQSDLGTLNTVNNVKTFGATGNGSTDDTTAITNALAAGGITFFPAGTYLHTGLTLASGAYLRGVGCGFYGHAAPTTQRSILKLKNAANADSVTIPASTSYVTIENIEVDGNATNQTSNGIGIKFADNSVTTEDDSRLLNVEVHNSRLQGFYYGAFRRALFANRVIASACGSHGIHCIGSDTTWIKTVTGNHSTNAKPLYVGSVGNRFYGGDAFGASNTQNIYFNGIGCSIVGFSIDHADNEGVFVDSGADELQLIANQFHSNSLSGNNGAPDVDISNAAGAVAISIVGNDFGAIDGVPTNKRSYAIKCGTVRPIVAGNGHNATATATGYTDNPASVASVDALYAPGMMDSEQFITLTSAYTLTSQTAAQKMFNAPTSGQVSLAVGTYFFECFLDLSSMSASSGAFGWDLTAGTATIAGIKWYSEANKAALATAASPQSTVNTAANTAICTATTNTVGWAKITGKVRISAAGTVIPKVSLGVAAAAIVSTDSYFRIWPAGTATIQSVGSWS